MKAKNEQKEYIKRKIYDNIKRSLSKKMAKIKIK
jgi:hypothetical protein